MTKPSARRSNRIKRQQEDQETLDMLNGHPYLGLPNSKELGQQNMNKLIDNYFKRFTKKITLESDNILEYIMDSNDFNTLSYQELYNLTNLLILDYNRLNIEFHEKRNDLESLKQDELIEEIEEIIVLGNATIERNKQEIKKRISDGNLN